MTSQVPDQWAEAPNLGTEDMIMCWLIRPITHLRSKDRWVWCNGGKMISRWKEPSSSTTSFNMNLTWIQLGLNLRLGSEKPINCLSNGMALHTITAKKFWIQSGIWNQRIFSHLAKKNTMWIHRYIKSKHLNIILCLQHQSFLTEFSEFYKELDL